MSEQKLPKAHCMEVMDGVSSGCGAPSLQGGPPPLNLRYFWRSGFVALKVHSVSLKGISPLGKVCNMG